MLNLNELARQVHENAHEHGWWETNISSGELVAWLHSELSEAYEEYRQNHPKVWYSCADAGDAKDEYCGRNGICTTIFPCSYRANKPEGIAVELIDVCLLILDYVSAAGAHMENCSTIRTMIELLPAEYRQSLNVMQFPDFIAHMHMEISIAFSVDSFEDFVHALIPIQAMIYSWIEADGLDPEAILMEKFQYNKSRPYRHGR